MADNQIELVKSKTDIVEIIGERVTLKPAGRNLKGLCPFHGEKTPSFFVSPEMQMYKCFGCGVSGDVLSFLQAFEGQTFHEALESLAKRVGVKLERSYQTTEDKKRERILEALHLASELYHYVLMQHPAGKAAREYLKERKITDSTIKTYKLGFAPDQWQMLTDYLIRKKKMKEEELVTAGLAVKGNGGRLYDRFRGRVMFPQMTPQGTTVGFSGRLLDKNAKEAKYINSPETQVYHKGELLYGLFQARSTIRKENRVVVVEGEFDVLSSIQAFVPETVAVKGSALTREQALLLKRLTNKVIIALDADPAGQEAIRRAIEVAEPVGLTLLVTSILGGKDPDEMAKTNSKGWREAVDKPVSAYEFLINMAFTMHDATTGTGQKEITKMVLPTLKKIENKVEQAFYIKLIAERLDVSTQKVEEELNRIAMPQAARKDETKKPAAMKRREKLERYVVGIGLHLGRGAKKYWEQLEEDWFSETYLKQLVVSRKNYKGNTKEDIWAQIPEEMLTVAHDVYADDNTWFEVTEEELQKLAERVAQDLKRMATRDELTQLTRTMMQTEDPQEVARLRAVYQQLKQLLPD